MYFSEYLVEATTVASAVMVYLRPTYLMRQVKDLDGAVNNFYVI